MESLLVSTGAVAISEIGDKTQLLALLLATRFRQPVPIILGILIATVLNHAVAALAGSWVASAVDPEWLRWGVALLFLAMAAWALIPDKIDEGEVKSFGAHGAFLATTIAFFLAEMGDKTQIATAALAARFETVIPVVIGTTAGMLIADVPAVLCGHAFAHKINPRYVRYGAAVIFAGLGITMLMEDGLFA
ncbi:MAG TPA: TMEM165/GDT1 family protein [Hypericibacter adhaerens]|jgi:putative Ca2+/H+ antiporter (TMEM165/GDT1 family)|uniref:TMEM165/GDT1 family protein n=1 Tax=Hypericibacter adhaerens TaxID=2602016 RepID=UPI002C278E5F|nr:TMEM165/GDT1 family protein [Hypericibacter adhaerens]HWA42514.1 TMEM165/GDT1 family protein [Hypericibacter adhaerens]